MAYTYSSKTKDGLTLHVIETTPDQIELLDLNRKKTLKGAQRYGINGGYYDMLKPPYSMLNLAMCDGQAIEYGFHDCGWGFLSWDGQKFSMEFATTGSEVKANLTSKGSWGQGGYRMLPGYKNWKADMISSSEADEDTLVTNKTTARSALVANVVDNKVYLISTSGSTSFNMATFREAIAHYFGFENNGTTESSTYKGIILDGGLSTQFRCAERKIETSRPLRQVIVLRDISG